MLLAHAVACVCVLTVPACLSVVTTETVVGVAGQAVALPCRSEAAVAQRGVAVCWGRGVASLFSCHDTVTDGAAGRLTYRKSLRFSVSPSSSLLISESRPSDAGFYHCRVQLPGLFNDQTTSIHLIIIHPPPIFTSVQTSELSEDEGNLNAPQTPTGSVVQPSDWDGTDDVTQPAVAAVQLSVQQRHSEETLHLFVGNTLRISFILFVPALLLTAAYRFWRPRPQSQTDRRSDQSEGEGEGSMV